MTKIVLPILLIFLPLWGDDLILSFRGVYQENRVFSESFNISRAMVPHADKRIVATFELETQPEDKGKTLIGFLKERQDEVVEALAKNGILMTDSSNTTAQDTTTKTVITLPALHVRASIKGSFVSIAVLE